MTLFPLVHLPVLQPYLAGAAAAGVASWICLHKRDIRGTTGLTIYSVALLALYSGTRLIPALSSTPVLAASWIAAVYFTTLISVTLAYRLGPWHPLASYPGPFLWRTTSMWMSFISLGGTRHLILDRLHARHGPFVRIGPNILSISSPTAITMYNTMDKGEAYRIPDSHNIVGIFFKNELENAKDVHRERRRIWNGLFSPSGIQQLVPVLEKRTWELMQCFERRQAERGVVDVTEAFYHWAHDFMGDMVFSGCNKFEMMKNGDPQEVIATCKLSVKLHECFSLTPWLFEILWYMPAGRDMHIMMKIAAQMVRVRRNTKDLPGFRDLMSYLMEGGVKVQDLERDAVVAILGGTDNTSTTLGLALYFLTSEPRYYQRLRAELDATFSHPLGPCSLNTLASLPFLNAVIQECLRLGTPFFLPREPGPGGAHVDGRFIPEGTVAAFAAWSQQTSPDNFYPEPMSFRPERWLPEGLGPDTKTNKAVLASFSYGPYSCIGKPLAYHEIRHMLARIVLVYDFEFEPGFDIPGFYAGLRNTRTTRFVKNMKMKVSRRPGLDLDAFFKKLD